jgi:ABC-type oligopeptide transport system ATPase subunit
VLEGDVMLRLERVSKTYRVGAFGRTSLTAVHDATFELKPGEVVSLIGESGSGKSTIGRLILRLTKPTSGTITFEGKDITGLRSAGLKDYYRNAQGVFQDPFSTYNPIFRADRVFAMIRQSYFPSVRDDEWTDRVAEAVRSVNLNPDLVLGKYPHQLSGGQLQRLLVARALLLDIKLLVADEIISMLDASTRIDVLNLLADLKERGLAVLFITHDLSLGNYLSDQTVILRRGSIVERGATDKVFGDPRHPYTRMLLASVPRLGVRWEDLPIPKTAAHDGDAALDEVEDDHFVAHFDHMSTVDG